MRRHPSSWHFACVVDRGDEAAADGAPCGYDVRVAEGGDGAARPMRSEPKTKSTNQRFILQALSACRRSS